MSAKEPSSSHDERALAQGLHFSYRERCAIYGTSMARLPSHLQQRVRALGRQYEQRLEPLARSLIVEVAGDAPTAEALCKRAGLRFLDRQLDETTVLAGETMAGRIHELGDSYGIQPLDAGVIAGLLCEHAWQRVQHAAMKDYLSSTSVPKEVIDDLLLPVDRLPVAEKAGTIERHYRHAARRISYGNLHASEADNSNYTGGHRR